MPIAYWRDEYITGNEMIDTQHQHLFEIVNRLHDAMMQGHGRDVLEKTLDDLILYTMDHFHNEEMIMVTHQYPAFEEHKAKHDELRAKVGVLREKLAQANMFLSIEVSKFLTDWLIHHIMGSDQKMIHYFRSHHCNLTESHAQVL